MMQSLFKSFLVAIVIDLGSSLFKVVFTGAEGHPEPLAISPHLVSGVNSQQIATRIEEYGDFPLRSAWIEVDGQTYAGGEFATDLTGRQYHELSKWQELMPRVLLILGLIGERLQRPEGFQAQVALLLPRDEVNPPDREAKLADIIRAANQFQFRGASIACDIEIKVATEGAGLFAAHAVSLEQQGINPQRIDIPVVMGGERNTSVLVYRAGRINPALSSSDGPGFYKFADQMKRLLGVPVPLPDVIRAIAQQRDRLRSSGNEAVNISSLVPAVLDDYASAIQAFLQAKLPQTELHLIAGGGAFSLIWSRLSPWLEEMEWPATYLGSTLEEELIQLLSLCPQEFDLVNHPALPARFADALSIYKAMVARHHQQFVQSQPSAKVR